MMKLSSDFSTFIETERCEDLQLRALFPIVMHTLEVTTNVKKLKNN